MTELQNNIKITDLRVHPGDSAFLIDDGETAILYDSGFGFTGRELADRIEAHLGERTLDYIFLTHSHYDHVLGSAHVKKRYPRAVTVAHEYAAKIFEKPGAKATMRELDGKLAARCGVAVYDDLTDSLSVDLAVKDEDSIRAGNMNFTVVSLPGHTKCSVGFLEENTGLLLCCETVGVYDGKRVIPACLVGYQMALDSIERATALRAESVLVPHSGILSGEECRHYFERAYIDTTETAREILGILRSGGDKTAAVEHFKKKYLHGDIREMYPVDAMELNTGIMVQLIAREYGLPISEQFL